MCFPTHPVCTHNGMGTYWPAVLCIEVGAYMVCIWSLQTCYMHAVRPAQVLSAKLPISITLAMMSLGPLYLYCHMPHACVSETRTLPPLLSCPILLPLCFTP